MGAFAGALSVLALAEVMLPRRAPSRPKLRRWRANLGIVLIDALTVRLLFATGAVGASLLAADRGWGVLNQFTGFVALKMPRALLVLDLALYLQHRLFHAVPVLWRLHMVHHADPDVDVTTGVRFHPAEVALSMLIKVGIILLIGASASAVLLFEVLLNAMSMFNHSNLRTPGALDRLLRTMLVTPDMHRVHHSVRVPETNSNFGFDLSWWDRLFRTYRPEPRDGHAGMVLGLHHIDAARATALSTLLVIPFTDGPGSYPASVAEDLKVS